MDDVGEVESGFCDLFAGCQLNRAHERRLGISPFQAEAGILVAAQVVKGTQFPAFYLFSMFSAEVISQGGQIIAGGCYPRDERGADPEFEWPGLAMLHIQQVEQ